MANTYSQIYIQIVFAVQERRNLISPGRKEELHKYITGIVTRQVPKTTCRPLYARSYPCLNRPKAWHVSLGPGGDMKTGSTNHINEKRWVPGRFAWQEGFGAFSYSHSQLTSVINYIRDQVQRHRRKTFREEYLQLLKKFEIAHDESY